MRSARVMAATPEPPPSADSKSALLLPQGKALLLHLAWNSNRYTVTGCWPIEEGGPRRAADRYHPGCTRAGGEAEQPSQNMWPKFRYMRWRPVSGEMA